MGFRFRKSINIIPGVRLNLSNGSPSLSVGPRGASFSFGSRGTFANLGLPGTGLSYRTRLDQAARSGGGNSSANSDADLRQHLEQKTAELMSAITAISNIHELTPDPQTGISWSELESAYRQTRMSPFQIPAPVRPEKPDYLPLPEQPGEREGVSFLGKWFESGSAKSERHADNHQRWQQALVLISSAKTRGVNTVTSSCELPGPNSLPTGSLKQMNMRPGWPQHTPMLRSSLVLTQYFLNPGWLGCSVKRNGRVKRLSRLQ